MKKLITLVAMILCLGITAHAAAMPVTMPYVPPMEVQIYDTLFNASGVTAIDESDEQKRLNAYVDLFTKALGLTAESFLEDMREVVENAKVNKQIVLDTDAASLLQQAVKYAMETGYSTSDEGVKTFPTYEVFLNWYHQKVRNLPISRTMYEQIKEYWLANPSYIAIFGTMQNGTQAQVCISSIIQGGTNIRPGLLNGKMWQMYSDGSEFPWVGDYSQVVWSPTYSDGYGPYYYYGITNFIEEAGELPMNKVIPKDSATQQAISTGKNAILTSDSVLTESDLLDTTKPVVINIYRNITYPATTAEDIDEKQRELVVTNITTDEDALTKKETLEDIRTETYGDTEAYKLDLLNFFPFCIPRDVMMLLQAFVAEPQTPEFDIPFPTWENGEMTTMNYKLSLSQFESLASALRIFEIVVFTIGLLVVTRQKYLRG